MYTHKIGSIIKINLLTSYIILTFDKKSISLFNCYLLQKALIDF